MAEHGGAKKTPPHKSQGFWPESVEKDFKRRKINL
jgi:hypothetical protein